MKGGCAIPLMILGLLFAWNASPGLTIAALVAIFIISILIVWTSIQDSKRFEQEVRRRGGQLAHKRNQLVKRGEYGEIDDREWNKEIDKFLRGQMGNEKFKQLSKDEKESLRLQVNHTLRNRHRHK